MDVLPFDRAMKRSTGALAKICASIAIKALALSLYACE